jgi:hypothetical protein
MRIGQLERLIEQPQFQRSLLHGFSRGYALGIGRDPEDPSEPVVYLEVEGDERPEVPEEIEVAGKMIRVITKTGFRAPRPYAAHR